DGRGRPAIGAARIRRNGIRGGRSDQPMTAATPPPGSLPAVPDAPLPHNYARAPGGAAARLRDLWESGGMLLLFALLFAGCAIFVPNFLSRNNMIGLSLSVTTVGIVACTMLFCFAAGDFDLSVGSAVALAGVVAAYVANPSHSVALG